MDFLRLQNEQRPLAYAGIEVFPFSPRSHACKTLTQSIKVSTFYSLLRKCSELQENVNKFICNSMQKTFCLYTFH